MNRIFPPQDGSTGLISAQFEVLGLTVVDLVGLKKGDCVSVQQRLIDGCDFNEWQDVQNGCCDQCVCYPQNKLVLAVPGQYRIMFENQDGSDLNDSSWFENTKAYARTVSSNQDLLTYLTQGDCDMGCNAGASVAAIMLSGTHDGWDVVLSDGTVLPIDIIAGDGITIDGNVITNDCACMEVITNPDGSFTLTDGTNSYPLGGTSTTVTDNGDGTYTIDDGTTSVVVNTPSVSEAAYNDWVTNGGTGDFDDYVADTAGSTTVTDNGDGTHTIDDGTNSVIVNSDSISEAAYNDWVANGGVGDFDVYVAQNSVIDVKPDGCIDGNGSLANPLCVNIECLVSASAGNLLVIDPTDGKLYVGPPNNPPTLNDDGPFTGVDNDAPFTVDVLANDTDSDGTIDPSTVSVTSPASPNYTTSVDPLTGEITVTPTSGFVGTETICYTASDDDSDAALVNACFTIEFVTPPLFAAGDFSDPNCWFVEPGASVANDNADFNTTSNFTDIELNQTCGIKVTPGQTYTHSIDVLSVTTANRFRIQVRYYDAGGNVVGPANYPYDTLTAGALSTGTITFTDPAVAGADYMTVILQAVLQPGVFVLDNYTVV